MIGRAGRTKRTFIDVQVTIRISGESVSDIMDAVRELKQSGVKYETSTGGFKTLPFNVSAYDIRSAWLKKATDERSIFTKEPSSCPVQPRPSRSPKI